MKLNVIKSSAKTGTERKNSNCDCRTDKRSFVLLSDRLVEEYSELLAFAAKIGWEVNLPLGAVRAELGSGHKIAGVAELVNALRGIFEPEKLDGLRAAWIKRGKPLDEQYPQLLHAQPILSFAAVDSTPLLEILQSKRLESWFQPIVSAVDYSLRGYECLMRGRSASGDLVYPDKLIAWSRQENLTFMLDRICREMHLRNAGRYLAGSDLFLTLNFLPTAIYNPESCLATTVAAAKAANIPPERIIFEVVETEKVTDLNHLRNIIDYYRAKGFRVALDDVGSGYAGLDMLAELSPDLIKIDRQLIVKAVASPMHRSICAALTQMGHDNGKLVLAEGIERVEERDLLASMGVDLFQGYLFGRPAPQPQSPTLIDS